MFWTRHNRHLTDGELSAYLDGELTSARRAEADAHIETCSECSTALAELREVTLLVSRLPQAELPRSFLLTPQMAGAGATPQRPAPRRSSFVFAPAAAFTVLLALFAFDLASSTSVSRDETTAAGQQAMIAKDASSAAGAASDSAERSANTFTAPSTSGPAIQPTPSQQPAAIPPPSTGGQGGALPTPVTPAPSTAGPLTGQGITPPTPGGLVPPATGPGLESVAPTPPSAAAPRLPAPSTGAGATITSQAESAAGAADSFEDGQDADGARDAARLDNDGGTDWLRIGQLLAAIVFIVTLAFVFAPGLLKKGSQ